MSTPVAAAARGDDSADSGEGGRLVLLLLMLVTVWQFLEEKVKAPARKTLRAASRPSLLRVIGAVLAILMVGSERAFNQVVGVPPAAYGTSARPNHD